MQMSCMFLSMKTKNFEYSPVLVSDIPRCDWSLEIKKNKINTWIYMYYLFDKYSMSEIKKLVIKLLKIKQQIISRMMKNK